MLGNVRGGIFSRISQIVYNYIIYIIYYYTRENENRKDMGVVASKRHVNRLSRHCIVTSSEILLFQAHTDRYLQVSLLLLLIHCQQQSLSN